MFDFIRDRFSHQFNSFRQRWCQQRTLPFTDVLSAERVEALLVEEGVEFRESVFTPLVTLWTFLGQVFHPDHSCREAVARLIAFLVGQGQRPCAAGTGAYCEARQRLWGTAITATIGRWRCSTTAASTGCFVCINDVQLTSAPAGAWGRMTTSWSGSGHRDPNG